MHVAVAMGVPTIALFGPETPRRYGPIGEQHTVFFSATDCAPCITFTNEKQVRCHRNAECMMRIPVEDVWAAAKGILEK
jgi:ADP-heptose:LPS heptosyltransferase